MYYNKHKRANPRLTNAMITISFSSFKCGLPMIEQDKIDEHINNVDGVEEGATSLKPIQEIDVDTKITFSLPSLLDIELVGPDKRIQVIHSIYTCCVSRGVINKTSNKNTADLRDSRSREFMIELDKSSPKTYFARFKMYLMY